MKARAPIEIQPITRTDNYAQDAYRLCWEETGYELLWSPNAQVYGALELDSSALVGMSQLYVDYHPGELYIARLAVTRTHQGRGIGSALINHAVEVAIGRHCDVVSTQPTNHENGGFYDSHGFRYDRARDHLWYRVFRTVS
jgi:ribosomal protein S18 acetylase RimI-like enzyme